MPAAALPPPQQSRPGSVGRRGSKVCFRLLSCRDYSKYGQEHPLRRIRDLKGLASTLLEVGSIVCEVIAALLRRVVKSQEHRDPDRSHKLLDRSTRRHIRSKCFQEAFHRSLPGVEGENLLPPVVRSLQSLLGGDWWRWRVGEAPRRGDGWLINPPGYGEVQLGEQEAFCMQDFIFCLEDSYHVIDRKKGGPMRANTSVSSSAVLHGPAIILICQ